MAKLLITGGTGFIGARLLELAHPHHTLHIITHTRAPQHGTPHPADLRDRDAIQNIITRIKPDAIIHLAAAGVTSGKSNLHQLLAVNVLGLQTILESATTLETPPHIVLAGSWFEYAPLPEQRPLSEDDPLSTVLPYSTSKLAATTVAQHYAPRLPITNLRIFSVYGIGEPLPRLAPYIIEQTRKGESIDLTACEQVRDYVFADDVAEGFLRATETPPTDGALRTLNLGTGQGIQLRAFVEQIGQVLKVQGYNPEFHFGARPYRPNEMMHAVAKVTQLENVLHWKPQTPLINGIQQMIDAQLA